MMKSSKNSPKFY